jgi:hypothetical protein
MVCTFNEYTVFAVNGRNEQLGDALLVGGSHLVAAIDALTDYWEAQQDENDLSHGVHTEVHEGSVRDCNDWRPLPWQPGEPVLDSDSEAERQKTRTLNG